MRHFLAVILSIFLVSQAQAATINADSCSYSDVNTAVGSASRGDTVVVPSGTCSWDTTLTVTQSITLQGAGVDTTTITAASGISTDGLIHYHPSSPASEAGYTFRVTGFTFDTNALNTNGIYIVNASSTYVQIRIDSNEFLDASATLTNRMIRNEGTIKGVIHSNIFDTANKKIVDSYGQNTIQDWSGLSFSYGSANNIYVEDNTITIADTPHSCGQGGRHVLRYNTYTFAGAASLSPWFDAHGNQDDEICNSWATRGVEIYGNALTDSNNRGVKALDHRGGQGLFFYNKVTTTSWMSIVDREEYADSICSETYVQHVNNAYYWANQKNTTLTLSEEDPASDDIAENTDWFNHQTSFDGTVGMGCGAIVSRPATCTVGVGYWATTQSCSDLTGMIGAGPSTPISGTLYKCTSTDTWTELYTPYTYPHPLRGEAGGGGDGAGTITFGSGGTITTGSGGTITLQ